MYWLEYFVNNKPHNKYYDHFPTDEETYFLIERNDITRAILWKKVDKEWIRISDLI